MKEWCLGFILTADLQQVILLKKSRTMHIGMWNGVGGKIEPDELPLTSMIRESGEETGLFFPEWVFAGRLKGSTDAKNWCVHVYATAAKDDIGFDEVTADYAHAVEADKPYRVRLDELTEFKLAPHALPLIYIARTMLRTPDLKPIVMMETD